jgi:hypothetical protein
MLGSDANNANVSPGYSQADRSKAGSGRGCLFRAALHTHRFDRPKNLQMGPRSTVSPCAGRLASALSSDTDRRCLSRLIRSIGWHDPGPMGQGDARLQREAATSSRDESIVSKIVLKRKAAPFEERPEFIRWPEGRRFICKDAAPHPGP